MTRQKCKIFTYLIHDIELIKCVGLLKTNINISINILHVISYRKKKSRNQENGKYFKRVPDVFQVSWIRHHDLHILTVGGYTYTADMRFRSIYNAPRLYINRFSLILQIHSLLKIFILICNLKILFIISKFSLSSL